MQKQFRPWARFITGQPGTGKTFLVRALIRTAVDMGLQVLNMSPTGKLVAACPQIDGVKNYTFAKAFGLMTEDGLFQEWVHHFSVWVVGEVNMISKPHMENVCHNA